MVRNQNHMTDMPARKNPAAPLKRVDGIRLKKRLAGRSVVLIGLMGAGKSCIGRMMSKHLNLPFLDADKEIEQAANCSVADIFNLYGEAEFRRLEAKVIERLLTQGQSVLATGGGAFMRDTTRKMIAACPSLTRWLRADLALLVKRTAGRHHRPLLNVQAPEKVIAGLIAERYPVYGQADLIFDCTESSREQTCEQVLALLDRSL